jgi:hypothetical protein
MSAQVCSAVCLHLILQLASCRCLNLLFLTTKIGVCSRNAISLILASSNLKHITLLDWTSWTDMHIHGFDHRLCLNWIAQLRMSANGIYAALKSHVHQAMECMTDEMSL